MKIISSSFIKSSSKSIDCPDQKFDEFAFIGRSNVGKSSLINAICNKKNLAKTSSRPGKTQLINHFLINKNWHLVDLPGFGYARVSKTDKKKFQKFITNYFKQRKQLVSAFLLIDIRHEPQSIDLNFMQWLGENYIPFSIVFTKADKLKPATRKRNINDYTSKMLETQWEELPPIFITSSLHKTGSEEILTYINSLNKDFTETNPL